MAPERDNPIAYLDGARTAVEGYNETKKQLEQQREAEQQTGRAIEQLKRETQDKIDKTLRERSDEIAATYDQQLRETDTKIKNTQADRDKARKEGVRSRIAAETEPFLTENKELRRQRTAILKKEKAPGFTDTELFYILFMPKGTSEHLIGVAAFLLCFAALPLGIYRLIPGHKVYMLIIIYILDILLFGALIVHALNIVNVKFRDAVLQGRNIRDRILQNKKAVRDKTAEIHADKDDSRYHLESFDASLEALQQERVDIISRKQSAQNEFENVTKQVLTDEIETAAKPKLEELEGALSEAVRMRTELETQEKAQALELSEVYETYLGKSHMNAADIEKMTAMIQEGEANSVMDAVTRMDSPK